VDSENPRVEITIKRFRHQKENYRVQKEAEIKAKEERRMVREAKNSAI
jgi:hypothetical protein